MVTKPTVRAAIACPMVAASSCAVTNMLGMPRLSRIVRSLLGQIDFATSLRTTSALVIVILLGGIVASIAFTVVELRPELPWLFLILLAVGPAFGGAGSGRCQGRQSLCGCACHLPDPVRARRLAAAREQRRGVFDASRLCSRGSPLHARHGRAALVSARQAVQRIPSA